MPPVSPAVLVLIVINVALFLINSITTLELNQWLALYYPDNPNYGIWQYITSMFMHGSVPHILFNMFGLYMFGCALERMWGVQKFLFFYFVAGIGAGIIYTLVNYFQFSADFNSLIAEGVAAFQIREVLEASPPLIFKDYDISQIYHSPMVGASGALYGVIVAFAIRYPNAKLFLLFIPFPIAAKFFVPGLLLLDLFSGVTGFSIFGGGIAHFAHLGGALVGFLMVFYWRNIR